MLIFFTKTVSTVHSEEFRKILSHTFRAKMLKIFRESNALIAFYSKMVLEMVQLVYLAQVWPIWAYRGRFGLLESIATSDSH